LIRGSVPAISLDEALWLPDRGRRDIRAFTPVLTGYGRR
jgi:hypothetical protein